MVLASPEAETEEDEEEDELRGGVGRVDDNAADDDAAAAVPGRLWGREGEGGFTTICLDFMARMAYLLVLVPLLLGAGVFELLAPVPLLPTPVWFFLAFGPPC